VLSVVLSLIFWEKPLLDILAVPQLLGLFKIVVGRLPELLLCKRITRCSRPRVEVVRHFAKFGDRMRVDRHNALLAVTGGSATELSATDAWGHAGDGEYRAPQSKK
jgi:hypothetical protein